MAGLEAILDATEAERLATGFVFTEGPLWHPDGFYYFVDVRKSVLYRMMPGRTPEMKPCKTWSVYSGSSKRCVSRSPSNTQTSTLVALAENTAKLVPLPLQVAPSGSRSPA